MNTYTHSLTELEAACGVTLDAVARELPRGAFIDGGRAFVTDAAGPALAGSVARCAFGGRPVAYAGHNSAGHAVYRLA